MSNKKNLLNESQIRQFMKLAKLEPLTPGFVNGLTERGREAGAKEELDELRTGRTGALGPKGGTANLGHGRGQGEAADGSMFEAAPVGELEDDAADDLAGGSPEEDEEAAVDLEKVGDEEADVAVDAVEAEEAPSEEEVLAALQVIARAAGVEGLEMDVESTGEPSVEDDLGPEPADDFAPGGDEEVVADIEVGEDELEEKLSARTMRVAGGGKVGGSPQPSTPEERQLQQSLRRQAVASPSIQKTTMTTASPGMPTSAASEAV